MAQALIVRDLPQSHAWNRASMSVNYLEPLDRVLWARPWTRVRRSNHATHMQKAVLLGRLNHTKVHDHTSQGPRKVQWNRFLHRYAHDGGALQTHDHLRRLIKLSWHKHNFIEGSLEAKLPTIWTDDDRWKSTARKKIRHGESQKGEDKKWRRSEKEKVTREDAQIHRWTDTKTNR